MLCLGGTASVAVAVANAHECILSDLSEISKDELRIRVEPEEDVRDEKSERECPALVLVSDSGAAL